MNLWQEFCKEALAEDGTWTCFILHKLVHVAVGCVGALIVMHLTGSFLAGFIAAWALGIAREAMKKTPMLLHVVTALITASGAFIALWLTGQSDSTQITVCVAMAIYSLIITLLQIFGIYPK